MASEEALPFGREKLLECFKAAGLSAIKAGRICSLFSQAARGAIPFTVKMHYFNNQLFLHPEELFGSYTAVTLPAAPSLEQLRAILALQSKEELLLDLERRVEERTQELQKERLRSEELLYAAIPKVIAKRLKNKEKVADKIEEATVLFADIANFTTLSSKMDPEEVVNLLSKIFSLCDELAKAHLVQPIKTIGDTYMAVTGLPEPQEDHLPRMIAFAQELLLVMRDWKYKMMKEIDMRIGMHTGEIVAGVISKDHLAYDVWGDTVNTASRMESLGCPGRIQVTQTVFDKMKERFPFEERGTIFVRGKGPMKTYFLASA